MPISLPDKSTASIDCLPWAAEARSLARSLKVSATNTGGSIHLPDKFIHLFIYAYSFSHLIDFAHADLTLAADFASETSYAYR